MTRRCGGPDCHASTPFTASVSSRGWRTTRTPAPTAAFRWSARPTRAKRPATALHPTSFHLRLSAPQPPSFPSSTRCCDTRHTTHQHLQPHLQPHLPPRLTRPTLIQRPCVPTLPCTIPSGASLVYALRLLGCPRVPSRWDAFEQTVQVLSSGERWHDRPTPTHPPCRRRWQHHVRCRRAVRSLRLLRWLLRPLRQPAASSTTVGRRHVRSSGGGERPGGSEVVTTLCRLAARRSTRRARHAVNEWCDHAPEVRCCRHSLQRAASLPPRPARWPGRRGR
mmetsp:Transcript_1568/g.5006  ORF Transcript_1568/g.5006 Transcript_1568/m.5006 type:complete len:279 (-) Transcript_1568:112-948(-)